MTVKDVHLALDLMHLEPSDQDLDRMQAFESDLLDLKSQQPVEKSARMVDSD